MLGLYEILWVTSMPGVLMHWSAIAKNFKSLIYKPTIFDRDKIKITTKTRIVFLIASRCCPDFVQDTIDSVNKSCKEVGFNEYDIKVVTDVAASIRNAELIVVPEDYTCNTKFKARSLNYALEFIPDTKHVWIFHLDEDSIIIPQTVISILKYIYDGGKPVSNGASVYVRNGNILTFYGEAHRMWTFLWLKELLKKKPLWMNGSNMLVRSDVEHELGWDHGNSFTEDTEFAYLAGNKKGNIFGWHGGVTIEQPASTVNGLLKQRKRWFYGSIKHWSNVPKDIKILRLYSIFSWHIGFYLSLIFFGSLLELYNLNVKNDIIFLLTGILWLGRYQIGLYYMLQYNNKSAMKRIMYHLYLLLLTPFVELLCTIPTLMAFVEPPGEFEITGKKSNKMKV